MNTGLGPFLALGDPDDCLAPLGAARKYFEDDRWRESFVGLLESSACALATVGRSANLAWALQTIRAMGRQTTFFVLTRPVQPRVRSVSSDVSQLAGRTGSGRPLQRSCSTVDCGWAIIRATGRRSVSTRRAAVRSWAGPQSRRTTTCRQLPGGSPRRLSPRSLPSKPILADARLRTSRGWASCRTLAPLQIRPGGRRAVRAPRCQPQD